MIGEIQALRDREEALQAESCPGLLSLKQAAEALGIRTRELFDLRREGLIVQVKEGHRVFIPEGEVERILAELSPGD